MINYILLYKIKKKVKTMLKDRIAMGELATTPISCLDCHDPRTMDLRISRPAFVEAMRQRNIDVAKATHQEMRSYVCGQCHVTYYFGKEDGYLKFPWDKGTSIDDIVSYFQANGFADWTHPVSGTPMIKIRHPEFEITNCEVRQSSDQEFHCISIILFFKPKKQEG